MNFIEWDKLNRFIEEASTYYEKSAPPLDDYLDNLYRRLQSKLLDVNLREITFVESLRSDGEWMQPNYAANRLYHLMESLGLDTTGHAGF
jgi:hypothetical protein